MTEVNGSIIIVFKDLKKVTTLDLLEFYNIRRCFKTVNRTLLKKKRIKLNRSIVVPYNIDFEEDDEMTEAEGVCVFQEERNTILTAGVGDPGFSNIVWHPLLTAEIQDCALLLDLEGTSDSRRISESGLNRPYELKQ